MKSSKVVHFPARDVDKNNAYDLYSSRIVKIERDYIESGYRRRKTNVSCQCDIKRDLCPCRRWPLPQRRYFSSPKHVYRYTDWGNFTDIGVGSIKALQRKRIRKIYLPETVDVAVGSADLSSFINRTKQQATSNYYKNKRTSSTCVVGSEDNDNVTLIQQKLYKILKKKSGTTSSKSQVFKGKDIKIRCYDLQQHKSSMSTQVNSNELNPEDEPNAKSKTSKIKINPSSQHTIKSEVKRKLLPKEVEKSKPAVTNDNADTCKDYSSDSFVQHIHNLENPSDIIQSRTGLDPMENKLEKEYRNIFTTKSKEKPRVDRPSPDIKSTSLLRRRFEALRRGLGKKESKKENILINKVPSKNTMQSHKYVSIASDLSSLEGRCSNTKVYSPYQSKTNENKLQEKITHKKSSKGKRAKDSPEWLPELGDSKYENIQGMFKLWGKKFNLDESNCETSPTNSNDVPKCPEKLSKPQIEISKKKQGKKFFIFGKKTKEKRTKSFKSKQGIITGRCEIKDGLTIKMAGANEYPMEKEVRKQKNHLEKYDNILRKAWLDKYINNTRESRNSVHIRWNNKMYATSSSTVLELMDSVYKCTGINIRSRSEIATGKSSNYHSYTKKRLHFMQQDIEAWMIPKILSNKHKRSTDYRNYHNNNKSQQWFVDETNGFSQKVELVLRSKPNSQSSEYFIINLPEGYFSRSSSDMRTQSSDEKIYKIVEYDTSELKKIKETRHMATGDSIMNGTNTKVSSTTQDSNDKQHDERKVTEIDPENLPKPSLLRDVAIQGSDVFVPKRCDVIGVGIITQRDIRDVKKPGLKNESQENHVIRQKKCELAESYLHDYYRNLMPSDIDIFSWPINDSQNSGNNSVATISQGDGTKSYSNVYDNFQESTIVLSSCETSSCSHCIALEEEKRQDESLTCFLSKFKKSSQVPLFSDKGYYPKDSIEVYKRRQFYAYNNKKSNWFEDSCQSQSMPSIVCKAKPPDNQRLLIKPCWRIPVEDKNRKQKVEKRVTLPSCEDMSKLVKQLSDKSVEGILTFKGGPSHCSMCKKCSNSPKRTTISSSESCEIPPPPCKETCVKEKKPPCQKKKSPPCDEMLQSNAELETPLSPRCKSNLPVCKKPVKRPPCPACSPITCPLSKTPSQESDCSLKISPNPSPKSSETSLLACSKKACSQPNKDCNPNSATQKKCHMLLSPIDLHNQDRFFGLQLRILPSKKKTNVDDSYKNDGPGVTCLNSNEKLAISTKKEILFTEDIRESMNIKVQSEDGQTLYERLDSQKTGDKNKCRLLKDVYKDSQIQRTLTPITVRSVTSVNKSQCEIPDVKSESSIDNLIEINFTLKLKQGDKGTEVSIKNAGDTETKHKNECKITASQKNVYMIQNGSEQEPAVTDNKKDVNINIVIKNYNNDTEKSNETEMYAVHNTGNNIEVFSKRISEKHETVSARYSDADPHGFSIHRATVDLTADEYGIQHNDTELVVSNEMENIPKKIKTSSQIVLERTVTDQTLNFLNNNDGNNSVRSLQRSSTKVDLTSNVISHEETGVNSDTKFEKCSITESKHYETDTIDKTSDESVLDENISLCNKEEKKAMLKKKIQTSRALKKVKNKKIKEKINEMLTSNNSRTEIAVTSNKLAKELTYSSLDPVFFPDTDSMNNFYQLDSDHDESKHQRINATKNKNEFRDNKNDVSSVDDKKKGCMCSTFAAKLNIKLNSDTNNGGCCCQGNVKKDEGVTCDVLNEDTFKTFMHVETQSSNRALNKFNSANLSKRRKTKPVVANTSVTIKKSIIESADKNKSSKPDPSNLNDLQYYGMKRFNRETILGLSDDDMLILNSSIIQTSVSTRKSKRRTKNDDSMQAAADILQLNETKKAVLEIYKEKIVSDEGEKTVAKLPKFHAEKENDIIEYILTGCKNVSKRNFVMMTINR